MATAEKISVSLPTDLLAHIEALRSGTARSRSETMAELLWRGWRALELEQREARYAAAYASQPETPEERAFAHAAGIELFGADEPEPGAPGAPTAVSSQARGSAHDAR